MFTVKVADNFHYMDENETYTHGKFATWAEALAAAQMIVDRCLTEYFQPGITPDKLFSLYTSFGDDPYIIPKPDDQEFSAWDYAKEQCVALCK